MLKIIRSLRKVSSRGISDEICVLKKSLWFWVKNILYRVGAAGRRLLPQELVLS